MTNDILEQITADYFTELGYFTQHNVAYRPNNSGTHSDIDVIAIHPKKRGRAKVVVVNCKSWQDGINIKEVIKALASNPDKIIRGGTMRKRFRDAADQKWSTALSSKVQDLTGQKEFTYCVSAVRFKGNKEDWKNFQLFKRNLPNCQLELLDLKEMIENLFPKLSTTPAHSELSRLLQLIKASRGQVNFENPKA